jgi:hypothetical protein
MSAWGFTVDEQMKDGTWQRCAQAHNWQSRADAHTQKDALAKRHPKRLYAVRRTCLTAAIDDAAPRSVNTGGAAQ